ncbi:MAG: P63C domain-containing protein [Aliidongia sp.]
MEDETIQSKGGKARAEKLTSEERRAIASGAAKARWQAPQNDGLPRATHPGTVKIGDLSIPCAVLEDGRRVLSEHGITTALGSRSGASKRLKRAAQRDGTPLPIFLAPSNLKPFISDELAAALFEPLQYRSGNRVVSGFEAKWLPEICDVWLRARDAEALQTQQFERAKNAEILIRGLAQIGIIALIDEATGYQEVREKDELHRLLAIYLSEERLKWAKRFPDEFYRQLYRLRGWSWPAGVKRTPYIGKLTNYLVYDRLPPGVLDELRDRNPTLEGTGRRRWKHHQFLSEDIGQPDLRDHLLQTIAIMRGSRKWDDFVLAFERAFPGIQPTLDFDWPDQTQP